MGGKKGAAAGAAGGALVQHHRNKKEAKRQEMDLRRKKGIRQGDVMTACQAACPAGAITFGDMNDERTDVYRWKA